jgi:hypothetical protein
MSAKNEEDEDATFRAEWSLRLGSVCLVCESWRTMVPLSATP